MYHSEKYYFPFITEPTEENKFIFTFNSLYQKIGDPISKEIFANRVLYNLTSDYKYVRKIVDLTIDGQKFSELLDSCGEKGAYIYGAGGRGDKIFHLYPDKNWRGFIDKNKAGETFCDLPVFSLEDPILVNTESIILISNRCNTTEIKEELIRHGVSEQQIVIWNEWKSIAKKKSYFEDSIINRDEIAKNGGAFIDAGCFNGTTTIDYLKWGGATCL